LQGLPGEEAQFAAATALAGELWGLALTPG
jgi:hypothetical protein